MIGAECKSSAHGLLLLVTGTGNPVALIHYVKSGQPTRSACIGFSRLGDTHSFIEA